MTAFDPGPAAAALLKIRRARSLVEPLPAGIARGQGVVRSKAFLGAVTRIDIEMSDGAILVVNSPRALTVAAGDTIPFGWRDEDALILPADNSPRKETL